MKNLLALSFALAWAGALVGCAPRDSITPDYKLRVESGEIDVARLELWARDQTGREVFAAWLASLGPATNRDEILTRYAVEADAQIVDFLAGQGPGELRRKLDTLQRGTSRHPYTREQLEAALARKAAR